ncbi:CoA pyrophosphatase [Endozoicomonas arenosclerae]|uniref:CoA pyrophosphatase n=1 Tax=Endozoicomonas arenosclerae TaxID=1633495 RepID=UPI0009A18B3A|nr:CoA pyrophosphatase [Endozoicomonas arenosclerae]
MLITEIEQRLRNHQPRTIDTRLPEAAVLVPLVTNHQGYATDVILTRRASHLNKHSGEVAFPGGKREEDDRDLIHTALRESHEEIDLSPSSVDVLGSMGPVISRFGIKVIPIIGSVPEGLTLNANAEELDRIFTVPIDFFTDQENLQFDHWSMNDKNYSMPSYQYGEYLIWGLTAIMLVEFLNVGMNTKIPLDAPQFHVSHSYPLTRYKSETRQPKPTQRNKTASQ